MAEASRVGSQPRPRWRQTGRQSPDDSVATGHCAARRWLDFAAGNRVGQGLGTSRVNQGSHDPDVRNDLHVRQEGRLFLRPGPVTRPVQHVPSDTGPTERGRDKERCQPDRFSCAEQSPRPQRAFRVANSTCWLYRETPRDISNGACATNHCHVVRHRLAGARSVRWCRHNRTCCATTWPPCDHDRHSSRFHGRSPRAFVQCHDKLRSQGPTTTDGTGGLNSMPPRFAATTR